LKIFVRRKKRNKIQLNFLLLSMKITKKDSILGLTNFILKIFGVKLGNLYFDKYHPKLPFTLKKLYEIDAFYAMDD
jgi:hypothetical protein